MSASELLSRPIESDSEEDPDFIPDDKSEGSESESENSGPERKRLRTDGVANEEDANKAREDAWERFQQSLISASSDKKALVEAPKVIEIERKYRFAGRIETTIIEVPEDSSEGKQWLASQEQASASQMKPAEQPTTAPSEPPLANYPSDSPQDPDAPPQSSLTRSEPTQPRPLPSKPRPKGGLSKLVGAKPQKLTTLQKSKMDWNAHLHSEEAQGFKDDLELNRRGGGYLEKVEFLDRVGDRLEESISSLKNKRKR